MIGPSWKCGTQCLQIAIANDDAARSDVLEHALRHADHRCRRFVIGKDLLCALESDPSFDAFVLERELPDINGIELLKSIRERSRCRAPIIFTSASDQENDVADALRLGADGYIVWPIQGAEFVARLEAIVRRGTERVSTELMHVDGYHLDSDARLLFHHDQALRLTEKEFNLATLLLANPGRLLSRTEIVQGVWGNSSSSVRWRTAQAYISRVRGKLGLTQSDGWRPASVHRHGYRLEKRGCNTHNSPHDLSP